MYFFISLLVLVTVGCRNDSPDRSVDDVAHDVGRSGLDADRDEMAAADMGSDTQIQVDVSNVDRGQDVPDATDMNDAGVLPDCPGDGAAFSAFFTRRPADLSRDRTLENVFIDLLDCASDDATIRASVFRINRMQVADAIKRASDRGLDIRVMIDDANRPDGGAYNDAVLDIQSTLGNDLVICPNGCIGSNINHNKFLTISSLVDGSENVVLQSSANLTAGQRGLHNNTVIVRDDAQLFAAYRAYWDDLATMVKNPDYAQRVEGDANTVIYVSPRATGDNIINNLNNMNCAGGGELRVAMSLFNRSAIADRLVEMENDGCLVSLVVRGDDEAPSNAVLGILDAGGIDYVQYREAADGWNVHSKYFIWNGLYGNGQVARKLVFTGSHNWNNNALRNNDETVLRVEDDAIYDAFLTDFGQLQIEAL